MKKIYALLMFTFLVLLKVNAQNAYYGSVFLKKYMRGDSLSPSNYITNAEKAKQDSLLIGSIPDSVVTRLNNDLKMIGLSKRDSILKYFVSLKLIDGKDIYNNDSLKAKLFVKINSNPFFAKLYLSDLLIAQTVQSDNKLQPLWMKNQQSESKTIQFSSSNIGSAISGLDVTSIATGVADLMIERAKDELTVAFFNRFKKFSTNNPEFQILFPKTTSNLSNLLQYNYTQMLPALRDGFIGDLKKITYGLNDVLALPKYQTLLENFPEVRIVVRSLRLVHELEDGSSNAAEIIKEFAAFDEWKNPNSGDADKDKKIKSAGDCLTIAALFSESIRNDKTKSGNNNAWISAKEIKQLVSDPTMFNIYMGLLYLQCSTDNINYINKAGNEVAFNSLLKSDANTIFIVRNKLQGFFDLTNKVNKVFSDTKAKDTPTNDDYYSYINVSFDAVDYACGIVNIFDDIKVADGYLAVARKSNSLYKDIYTQQYTQAVCDAISILSQLDTLVNNSIKISAVKKNIIDKHYSGATYDDVNKLANGSTMRFAIFGKDKNVDNVVKANFNDPNITQLAEYYNLKKLLDFINDLKPYVLFMANLVEAKDENAVKAALENAVLPVGSSSIKKNTSGFGNISVQSYLGAYYSIKSRLVPGTNISAWDNVLGVIAPVGISYTPGFLSLKNWGSFSPFISLFDLGAIVDYKLQRDSSATTNKQTVISKNYSVNLGQIFSPGIHFVYGFGANIPLSLGFGTQYGPGLSKIDNTGNAIVNNPYWRWNFFLAVDLPFFTLKNKNGSK